MTKRREYKNKVASSLGINLWGRQKLKVKRLKQLNTTEVRPSEYGRMLFAKQRLKGFYGNISEKQLYNYIQKDNTNFVPHLERRLDIVLFRMKFAVSVFQARQMINHKHILVNNKILNIPSYLLLPGDIITVHPKAKTFVYRNILVRLFEKQLQNNPLTLEESSIISYKNIFRTKKLFSKNTIKLLNIKNNYLQKCFYSLRFELKFLIQNIKLFEKLQHAKINSGKDSTNYFEGLFLKKTLLQDVLQEAPLFLLPKYLEINYKNLIGIYCYIPSIAEICVPRKFDLEEIKNFYSK